MSKNTKGLVVVLVVVAIAGGAYLFLVKGKSKTKAQQVDYLITHNYTKGTPTVIMAFGDDYINAWYNAAAGLKDIFTLSGITYNTQGGSAV